MKAGTVSADRVDAAAMSLGKLDVRRALDRKGQSAARRVRVLVAEFGRIDADAGHGQGGSERESET
jgi:hypothetical protein